MIRARRNPWQNLFWELSGKRNYLGENAKLFGYDPKRCHLFAFGRNAIYAACRIVNLTKEDEVLVPAWICDEALQPFRIIGCKLSFYLTVPTTFEVDLDSIKDQITHRTKLIHIVNHFGHSQPWEEIQQNLRIFDIPILEDNAYSLFSSYQGKMLGSFGNFSVFSLRKSLSLIDGGMLCINDSSKATGLKRFQSSRWYYPPEQYQALSLVESFIRTKIGVRLPLIKVLGKKTRPLPPPKSKPPLYSDPMKSIPFWPRGLCSPEFAYHCERPISRLSRLMLRSFTEARLRQIIARKRQFYKFLIDLLKNLKGITLINPCLKDGEVPYSVSMLIKKNRDYVLRRLEENYPVMAWPTLPAEVVDQLEDYPDVCQLGRQLFQFNLQNPIIDHPDIEQRLRGFVKDLKKALAMVV